MLNKEEYVEKIVRDVLNGEMKLENFVAEHFELIKKHEMLENTYSMLCQDYLNQQPYKFEDLKEGMLVWDSKEKWIRNIVILFKPCKLYAKGSFKAWADSCEKTLDFVEFEENRFFPIQIANVRCE